MKLSNKLNMVLGIVTFILAVCFSIALVLVPLSTMVYGQLQNPLLLLGEVLTSVYGVSSALIPLFLLVVSFFSFTENMNAKNQMQIATAIAPFFTIVGTEKLCRQIASLTTSPFTEAINVCILVCGISLALIEILGAGILSDIILKYIGKDEFENDESEVIDREDSYQYEEDIDSFNENHDYNSEEETSEAEDSVTEISEEDSLAQDSDNEKSKIMEAWLKGKEDIERMAYHNGHESKMEADSSLEEDVTSKEVEERNESDGGNVDACPLNQVTNKLNKKIKKLTRKFSNLKDKIDEVLGDKVQTYEAPKEANLTEKEYEALNQITWPSPEEIMRDAGNKKGQIQEAKSRDDTIEMALGREETLEGSVVKTYEEEDKYDESRDSYDESGDSYEEDSVSYEENSDSYDANGEDSDESELEYDPDGEEYADNREIYDESSENYDENGDSYEESVEDFDESCETYDESSRIYEQNSYNEDFIEEEARKEAINEEYWEASNIEPQMDEVSESEETSDTIEDIEKAFREIDDNLDNQKKNETLEKTLEDTSNTDLNGENPNMYVQDSFYEIDENEEEEEDDEPCIIFDEDPELIPGPNTLKDSEVEPELSSEQKPESVAEVKSRQSFPTHYTQEGLVTARDGHTNRALPKKKYEIPVTLLEEYQNDPYWIIDEATEEDGAKLIETLGQFNIKAKIIGIKKGPVVTMFELAPAPGVKLSKIVSLQDNIALNLAASSVRIVAPVPGKACVGIEVPNQHRSIVSFRELIEKDLPEFTNMKIPVILGKDVQGHPELLDLVKTPHLLIAGATGAGKSVCVNSMILSILYKRNPNEVKLILVDPKVVELKLYNNIPHLLTPVITEPKKALQSLQYCLCEMERRYSLLDGMGVRDISSYNKRIQEKNMINEKLPYIVVIIDEFADLMATTGKELETTIARLAAMSRAVGIHLVLATQRPSIDVITGLIKANIPSRIAFMVASKMDSRIIIDQVGAESLLGKGDMLYAGAVSPFPVRIQGTFVSDDDVEQVVTYVKTFGEPEYIDDEIFVEDEDDPNTLDLFENGSDPLYDKALEIILQSGKASASYIQRRLKIGYNRAARLIEEMEERGIVGPANGSKPRDIIHIPN